MEHFVLFESEEAFMKDAMIFNGRYNKSSLKGKGETGDFRERKLHGGMELPVNCPIFRFAQEAIEF